MDPMMGGLSPAMLPTMALPGQEPPDPSLLGGFTPPPPPLVLPKRKTRSLTVDKAEVVESVLDRLKDDLANRQEMMDAHLDRYAKYRGWIETPAYKVKDALNAHLPITMESAHRLEDGLYNAVMAQRPIMRAKATQARHAAQERRVTELVGHQVLERAKGEELIGDAIHNFVIDPAVHLLPRWVHDTQTIREFTTIPPPPDGLDLRTYLQQQVTAHYGPEASIVAEDPPHFTVQTPNGIVTVEAYEAYDGDIEIIESREVEIEHVGLTVADLEDIVVPKEAVNPQPPSESNPNGAHHVIRLCTASLDTIKSRRSQRLYDLLTATDLTDMEAWADDEPTDETADPKRQRDDIEGVDTQTGLGEAGTLHLLEVYDRWDVNGDGLEEDVIWWIVTNADHTEGRLARARYLTEIIPPGPDGPRRPIVKLAMLPLTNRYYGLSGLELIEGIQDLTDLFFNYGVDAGIIANLPFGFYRAASGLKPDEMTLDPGVLYPLDDPQRDVHFPAMPQMQGAWTFNTLSLLDQHRERLTMQGQLQYGGVPQGKSAALRTSANMQALMQQGDVREVRVIRRLLQGLSEVWDQAHALCRRYLPPETEYRVSGVPEPDEAFDRIDRHDLAGTYRFTWDAAALTMNPQMKFAQAQTLLQTLATPFLAQLQLVGPDELYQALRKYLEAMEEPNPDLFIKRPPTSLPGPRWTAMQVVSAILAGESVEGVHPAEPLPAHQQALMAFMQSDEFGMLSQPQVQAFGAYLRTVMEAMQQLQQQAMLAQAAGGLQQHLGQIQSGGQGGPPPGQPTPQATQPSQATPLEAGEGPQGMQGGGA